MLFKRFGTRRTQTPLFVGAGFLLFVIIALWAGSEKKEPLKAPLRQELNESLIMAVQSGASPDNVKKILSQGANIDTTDHDDKTALMIAAENGYVQIISVLLKKGADVNRKTRDGMTALMLAVMNDNPDAPEKLLDRKANINERNKEGETPLILAIKSGCSQNREGAIG